MLRKIGEFFTALRNREFISMEFFREDLRKLGLVWIGGGLIALVIQDKPDGLVPLMLGVVLIFFGLTRPKKEKQPEDNSDG